MTPANLLQIGAPLLITLNKVQINEQLLHYCRGIWRFSAVMEDCARKRDFSLLVVLVSYCCYMWVVVIQHSQLKLLDWIDSPWMTPNKDGLWFKPTLSFMTWLKKVCFKRRWERRWWWCDAHWLPIHHLIKMAPGRWPVMTEFRRGLVEERSHSLEE